MAQVGEGDTATGLLDDGSTDDGLYPSDVLADGRLREVQYRRGTVKSATVGDRHDTAQGRDVKHLTHTAKVLRSVETIKEPSFGE
jgi:hypothetical protein